MTEVIRLSKSDLKLVTKAKGWNFNWKAEFDDITKEVYKLTIANNTNIVQGLLSISIESDHVYMNLRKAHRSILENRKYMKGLQEIWLHTLVRFHFKKDMTAMSLLLQNPN